eukprot:9063876-Ditylum_brightwellii.AAC.1
MGSTTCNYVPQGNHCSRIKGLECADNRKEQGQISKEDAASSMVAPESVSITSMIDAKENRDVATTDMTGAYLKAEMDDYVIMVLEGSLAELLVKTVPTIYRTHVQLKMALYSCLKSALLFYKQLLEDLQEYEFIVNLYYPCVANKMVKGKQLTLRTTRQTVHEYLGMTLDFSKLGMVKVIMSKYLKEITKDFPEVIKVTVTSPAFDHLFNVDKDRKLLDKILARQFHTSTTNLLFVCKRARPDIQMAMSFLTKQAKSPSKDDWKKLRGGQDYKVESSKIYQDNLSAMLLEKNGKWLSGRSTKHINVCYIFVKDRIASGKIEVDHCCTENMMADARHTI